MGISGNIIETIVADKNSKVKKIRENKLKVSSREIQNSFGLFFIHFVIMPFLDETL